MADAHKIIATAGIISVSVGTINSFSKNHTPPSARFLIGSGAAFLAISALAEAEPEVAQALALAVMTTVLLGEGGGVLTYINGRDEINTTKKQPSPPKRVPNSVLAAGTVDEVGEEINAHTIANDTVSAYPNIAIPGLLGQGHRRDCRCTSCSGIFY